MIKNKEYYHAKKSKNITSELHIYNKEEKKKIKKYTFIIDNM